MTTINKIRAEVTRLAALIDAPRSTLPEVGPVGGYSTIQLETDPDGTMTWSVIERDRVLEQRVTRDFDELMYWAFRDVTQTMATAWESRYRISTVDFRAVWFGRQLYLLGSLERRWSDMYRRELLGVLKDLPYCDEDHSANLAAVMAFLRDCEGEFEAADVAAITRAAKAPGINAVHPRDIDTVRRLATYIGLVRQQVLAAEACAVASLIPTVPVGPSDEPSDRH